MIPGVFRLVGTDWVGVGSMNGASPAPPPLVDQGMVLQFVGVFAFLFLVAVAVFCLRELPLMRDPAPTRFVWNALRRRGGMATFLVLQLAHLVVVLAVAFHLMRGGGWILAGEGGSRVVLSGYPQTLALLGPGAGWISLLSLLTLASLFLATWKQFRHGLFSGMRLTGARPADMLRPLIWICFALDTVSALPRWAAAHFLLADPGATLSWIPVLPAALACRLAVGFAGISLLARAVTIRRRWQSVAEPVVGLILLQVTGAIILDLAAEATFSHQVQLSGGLLGSSWYQYGPRVAFDPLPLELLLACCVMGTLFLFAGIAWYSAAIRQAAEYPAERTGTGR